MNSERDVNKLGLSRAAIASVVFHVLILLGLGGGESPGPLHEPGVMSVYLAMPAAAPDRALVLSGTSGRMTASQPAQAPTRTRVQPKPQSVKAQPAAEILIPDGKPRSEPVPRPEIEFANQPEKIPGGIEMASSEKSMESGPDIEPDKENRGMESLTRNIKPETRKTANAMLAFAGDPVSLGMLGMDALGPDLVEAAILSLPEPVYPVLSRKRGEEGRVIVEVTISAQGAVRRAEVVDSSSYNRLDRAALKAVKTAIFSPATRYGTPVESVTKVAYRFQLKNE